MVSVESDPENDDIFEPDGELVSVACGPCSKSLDKSGAELKGAGGTVMGTAVAGVGFDLGVSSGGVAVGAGDREGGRAGATSLAASAMQYSVCGSMPILTATQQGHEGQSTALASVRHGLANKSFFFGGGRSGGKGGGERDNRTLSVDSLLWQHQQQVKQTMALWATTGWFCRRHSVRTSITDTRRTSDLGHIGVSVDDATPAIFFEGVDGSRHVAPGKLVATAPFASVVVVECRVLAGRRDDDASLRAQFRRVWRRRRVCGGRRR